MKVLISLAKGEALVRGIKSGLCLDLRRQV